MSQSTKFAERSTPYAIHLRELQNVPCQLSKKFFGDPENERIGASFQTNGPLSSCKLAGILELPYTNFSCTPHEFKSKLQVVVTMQRYAHQVVH
mmetsp:Transcript_8339/g.51994  ORF Transcript_8339/g.51994 Transcript_8339/m.51994 type:complete len:94 (+) Transcript_8339:1487-1768(+)